MRVKKFTSQEDIALEYGRRLKALETENIVGLRFKNPRRVVINYMKKKYGADRFYLVMENFSI